VLENNFAFDAWSGLFESSVYQESYGWNSHCNFYQKKVNEICNFYQKKVNEILQYMHAHCGKQHTHQIGTICLTSFVIAIPESSTIHIMNWVGCKIEWLSQASLWKFGTNCCQPQAKPKQHSSCKSGGTIFFLALLLDLIPLKWNPLASKLCLCSVIRNILCSHTGMMMHMFHSFTLPTKMISNSTSALHVAHNDFDPQAGIHS